MDNEEAQQINTVTSDYGSTDDAIPGIPESPKLQRHIIETVMIPSSNVHNGWSEQNIHTVGSWQRSIERASFVCDNILETNDGKVKRAHMWLLVLATLSTIINAIASAILTASPDLVWIVLACNIILFLISGASTMISGALNIYKWDDLVTDLATYIEKLDTFYATISAELTLPAALRTDAIKFIQKNASGFLDLMRISPNVPNSEYIYACQKYETFQDGNAVNFKCAQKYTGPTVIDMM